VRKAGFDPADVLELNLGQVLKLLRLTGRYMGIRKNMLQLVSFSLFFRMILAKMPAAFLECVEPISNRSCVRIRDRTTIQNEMRIRRKVVLLYYRADPAAPLANLDRQYRAGASALFRTNARDHLGRYSPHHAL
jgi:hypothetical protein